MTDAREIIALQEFAKWAIKEGAFLAAHLDCLSIHEKAHELGLIEATAYDPEKHGPSDVAETGDEWFTFSPILTTAGFRVLGPDEVDQVTLERAAEIATNWGSEIPAAIRALASGESR